MYSHTSRLSAFSINQQTSSCDILNESICVTLSTEINEYELKRQLTNETKGCIKMQIKIHLYNQPLSLWEPLVEPFNFELHGERDTTGYQIDIQSKNRLNVNITENLLFFQRDIATRLRYIFYF